MVPVFFLLFFGIIDCARLIYTQNSLQFALREAGRYATTGNHLPDPSNPGQNLSRVDSIIQVASQTAGRQLTGITIRSAQGGSGNAGGPGDTVTITLTYDLPLATPIIGRFFPNGIYHFTVSTTFKNEPFPPSQTL